MSSPLAGWQSENEPQSGMNTAEYKRRCWKEMGILVIDVNYRGLSNAERAFIENIGNKTYGRRVNGS